MKNTNYWRFFFALLCLASVSAQANKMCEIPTTIDYKISQKNSNQVLNLTLQRLNDKVVHYYPATEIMEGWELNAADQIKPTRYFRTHQRAIEYQPNESVHGKTEKDWSYRYQLVSDRLVEQAEVVSTSEDGCDTSQVLKLRLGNYNYHFIYKPYQKYLVELSLNDTQNGTVLSQWNATNVKFNKAKVTTVFALLADYQTTDFADIGDDHSDPFLINMVSIGFIESGASGHYQAFEENKVAPIGTHEH